MEIKWIAPPQEESKLEEAKIEKRPVECTQKVQSNNIVDNILVIGFHHHLGGQVTPPLLL